MTTFAIGTTYSIRIRAKTPDWQELSDQGVTPTAVVASVKNWLEGTYAVVPGNERTRLKYATVQSLTCNVVPAPWAVAWFVDDSLDLPCVLTATRTSPIGIVEANAQSWVAEPGSISWAIWQALRSIGKPSFAGTPAIRPWDELAVPQRRYFFIEEPVKPGTKPPTSSASDNILGTVVRGASTVVSSNEALTGTTPAGNAMREAGIDPSKLNPLAWEVPTPIKIALVGTAAVAGVFGLVALVKAVKGASK